MKGRQGVEGGEKGDSAKKSIWKGRQIRSYKEGFNLEGRRQSLHALKKQRSDDHGKKEEGRKRGASKKKQRRDSRGRLKNNTTTQRRDISKLVQRKGRSQPLKHSTLK